jgi:hypothetical protein
MTPSFRPATVLDRHAAAMRAQHPTHRAPRFGCPDCALRSTGRQVTIRYSPVRP